MPQFLITPENINNKIFVLKNSQVLHLIRVLRARLHEKIRLFDGQGNSYLGEITKIDKESVTGRIIYEIPSLDERILLNLFPSLIKANRFELLLEKVTEIGVNKIVPMVTQRTIINIEKDKFSSKHNRWMKIINSASQQCYRETIPELEKITNFDNALKQVQSSHLNLVAYEKEQKNTLKNILPSLKNQPKIINLFIGPEGGFTDDEIELAKEYKFIPFRLGKNILRTETACIFACSLILYEFDL